MEVFGKGVEVGLCSLVEKFCKKNMIFEPNALRTISQFALFNPSNSNLIAATSENQLQAVIYFLTESEEIIEEDEDDELPGMMPVLSRQDAYIKKTDMDIALEIAVEKGYEDVERELRRNGARLFYE